MVDTKTTHLLDAQSHAIAILQNCAQRLAYHLDDGIPVGSKRSAAITTCHNAVFYLLTGRLDVPRGVTETVCS